MFNPNPQQQAIINSPIEGASRVLAGPGSGKTATVCHRMDYLIKHGVNPDSILSVTFSKAMADSGIERALAVNPNVNTRQICTIHAICYRILREENLAREVGDAGTRYSWVPKKLARQALDEYELGDVGPLDFLSYLNIAKMNAVRHADLEEFFLAAIQANGGLRKAVPWADRAHTLLARAALEFERLMRAHQPPLMMYADMLYDAELLFQDHPDTLRKYQDRFVYVFIDEAQDTNPQAMRILTALAKPQDNIMVIGDSDQCIYAFNSASPETNLRRGFEDRYPAGLTFKMETNYRSTQEVVRISNLAIEGNYNDQNRQYQKTLVAREGADEGLKFTFTEYPSPWEEADGVIETLNKALWDQGREPGDFFIASRTRAQLSYLYGGLFRHRIPFVDKSGGNFFEAAHVHDVLSYLRLSVNHGDNDAFQRIYNKASSEMRQQWDLRDRETGNLLKAAGDRINHRWLGAAFLEACGGSFYGMADVEFQRKSWTTGIQDLREFMRRVEAYQRPADRAQFIVTNCVSPWWAMDEGGEEASTGEGGRFADMATIVDLASQFETTEEFLEAIRQMSETMKNARENGGEDDCVVLSTIHRLKGLERPVVYVIGVMDNLLPHHTALTDGFTSGDILPFCSANTIEDERCLFFVAISRAEEEVHLFGPQTYQNRVNPKSMFLREVGLVPDPMADAIREMED